VLIAVVVAVVVVVLVLAALKLSRKGGSDELRELSECALDDPVATAAEAAAAAAAAAARVAGGDTDKKGPTKGHKEKKGAQRSSLESRGMSLDHSGGSVASAAASKQHAVATPPAVRPAVSRGLSRGLSSSSLDRGGGGGGKVGRPTMRKPDLRTSAESAASSRYDEGALESMMEQGGAPAGDGGFQANSSRNRPAAVSLNAAQWDGAAAAAAAAAPVAVLFVTEVAESPAGPSVAGTTEAKVTEKTPAPAGKLPRPKVKGATKVPTTDRAASTSSGPARRPSAVRSGSTTPRSTSSSTTAFASSPASAGVKRSASTPRPGGGNAAAAATPAAPAAQKNQPPAARSDSTPRSAPAAVAPLESLAASSPVLESQGAASPRTVTL
jgi:hypothetical protein